ncbi:glycosyltransferase [Wenxinia saemankumensis]|uniref:Glycosyltransferase involved in cell wall bisynthesis n=1 Tax=Wenxinia saemankumensis TaxID=1447782 RepID=A0A1M6AU07_9RHOB|nr:glycosyltransferase [Wenxinia saemankumensis]SHI40009.1 Glycosyltransferase involved in cell wall bisynthesis [Wenxinia saemankumensis]
MRPLSIALVSHIRHPIRAPFMGGMEAHSWHLARGLAARGHEVTLFAAGDSDAGVTLRPVVAEHYDRAYPWHEFHGTDTLNRVLDDAFAAALPEIGSGAYDVVHNNTLHRYLPRLARRDRVPTLTSLHVPPFDALRRAVHASAAPWSRFTVCSERQRQVWWPEGAPEAAHVVGNGIDLADWPFSPAGDGRAVWAGRITPNKGTALAAEAAQIAGVPLTIFGAIEHRDYFEGEVRPFLRGDVRYGGHLSGADLAREFGRASALMFTPHWDEPFGLAAIEAMACGLPVAATEMGAVREVIGESGAYAPPDDAPALALALRQALALPREAARARVEARFSLAAMIDAYEALYDRAIAGRDAPAGPVDFPAIELPPAARAGTPAPPAPAVEQRPVPPTIAAE